jgi:hypothetical protein
MNNKILVVAAIAAMCAILVTAAILNQEASAKCKKKSQSQSIAQANSCGNGNLPLNIKCQNLASQVQGDGNAINVIGTQ